MGATNQNPIAKIFSAIYVIVSRMVTETPITFLVLCVLVLGFYYLKYRLINKYIKSKPIFSLPGILQTYFYNTTETWRWVRFFSRLIQFCLILLLFIYTLSTLGFKIPNGIIDE